MSDPAATVASALVKYYQKLNRKIHVPCGNSAGHLLLHLTGNLQDRIDAQVLDNGYQLNRDLEFKDASHLPKAPVP